MKPVAFDYCRPDTLDEALDLLAEYGHDAALMSGGLSLGALLNMRLARPRVVIDLNRLNGLGDIKPVERELRIGALVRQADAVADGAVAAYLPLLAEALPHVGHYQTRAYGTFGGSVAHADPSAEIPLALVTLGGAVELAAKSGRRSVPAREFFIGMLTTVRRPDEVVTGLSWPKQYPGTGCAFDEFSRRHGDFAIAALAAQATLGPDGTVKALSFGLGGVEDRPMVADAAMALGEPASDGLAAAVAARVADTVTPIADMQASPDYRRQLVRTVGAAVIARAFVRARASLEGAA